MSQAKKYDIKTEQVNNSWAASIVRKVSSTKTIVSQTKEGFDKESNALAWAKETLESFTQKQIQNNERKAEQRTNNLKISQDRSSRKAAKTAEIKAQKNLESTDTLRPNSDAHE